MSPQRCVQRPLSPRTAPWRGASEGRARHLCYAVPMTTSPAAASARPGARRASGLLHGLVVLWVVSVIAPGVGCLDESAPASGRQGPGRFDVGAPPDLGPDSAFAPDRRPQPRIVATPSALAPGAGVSTLVTLDGRGSSDPDGDLPLSYSWELSPCAEVEGTRDDSWLRCRFDGGAPAQVTLTVTDSSGAAATAVLGLPLNQPPLVRLEVPARVGRGVPVALRATVEDPEGEELEAALGLGGHVQGATLELLGGGQATLTATQPGELTVWAQAQDSLGATGRAEATVVVGNSAPELDFIGGRGVRVETPLGFDVSATDPDGDALVFDVVGLPPGASFVTQPAPAAPGDPYKARFDWSPLPADAGAHTLVFGVSDGWERDEETLILTVIGDPGTPVVRLDPPDPAHELSPGATLRIRLLAWDPDGAEVTLSAAPLPPGATFDAEVGLFELVAGEDSLGEHAVVFSASDGRLVASRTVLITVAAHNQAPQLVTTPAGGQHTLHEGRRFELHIEAADPDGDPVALSVAGLPPGATFDAASGSLTYTPGYDAAGRYSLELSASDGRARAERVVELLVLDTNRAPAVELDPAGELVGLVGVELSFTARGVDPDGDPVTLVVDRAPAGYSFDAPSGGFLWTPAPQQLGDHEVTLRATDGGAPPLVAVATVALRIRSENRAPAPTLPLPDLEIPLGGTAAVELLDHFQDPDGDPLGFRLLQGPAWATQRGTRVVLHPAAAGDAGAVATVQVEASDGQQTAEGSFAAQVSALPASGFTFERIAAPGDAGPRQQPLGTLQSPHLAAGERVVFGSELEGEVRGIYQWSAAEGVQAVAERLDTTPRRYPLRSLGVAYPVSPDRVLLLGYTWGASVVLSWGPDAPWQEVVRQEANAPGGLRLGVVGLGAPSDDGDFAWCGAPWGRPGEQAAFGHLQGVLRTVTAVGAPAPGGGTFGDCRGQPQTAGGDGVLVEVELQPEGWGLFAWWPEGALGPGAEHGRWRVIYRSDQPGGLGTFDSLLGRRLLADGSVAFVARTAEGLRQLWLSPPDGASRLLAAEGGALADGSVAASLGELLMPDVGAGTLTLAREQDAGSLSVWSVSAEGLLPLLLPGGGAPGGLRLAWAQTTGAPPVAPAGLLFRFGAEGNLAMGWGLRRADGTLELLGLDSTPLPGGAQLVELQAPSLASDGRVLFRAGRNGALYLARPR